ncbi:MAG: MBL fold metallo-hydrolase [Chromatiaceae bacterium]|jgi:beta-lactamase superfamily II metal-dependent hydrolase|nr:MBL fold metallo-hydrolase [Chromatiaceae bacterium]
MARLRAARSGCTVRMYRHGLGDCFLLAFGVSQRTQRYMLIDCGVLLGTPNAEARMQAVVKNIHDATGGHLDALVITHEHWDHVSGFLQAQQAFAGLTVDEVWFAWTENPASPLARELRERRRAALHGLRLALASAGPTPPLFARRIESVRAFFGPDLAATGRATTEDALDWVKQQWPNHRYCEPGGTPLTIDDLPEVRFYVLGPPADTTYLRRSTPTKRGGEVYLDDPHSGQLGLYLAALGAAPAVRQPYQAAERFLPFNEAYHRQSFDTEVTEITDRYRSEPWRQIDAEWIGAAGELALRLDAHTNNTSLVLAIELGRGDKVLLFPGDAQVGSWLSWNEVGWHGEDEAITTADLLARTVLYKVGHHGSHNATLREQGLERMTNAELIALIPVDREIAGRMRWRMPHEPLHERLTQKTLGRLVLSDTGLPMAAGDAVIEAFRGQCAQTDLFTDTPIIPWNRARSAPTTAGSQRPRRPPRR